MKHRKFGLLIVILTTACGIYYANQQVINKTVPFFTDNYATDSLVLNQAAHIDLPQHPQKIILRYLPDISYFNRFKIYDDIYYVTHRYKHNASNLRLTIFTPDVNSFMCFTPFINPNIPPECKDCYIRPYNLSETAFISQLIQHKGYNLTNG